MLPVAIPADILRDAALPASIKGSVHFLVAGVVRKADPQATYAKEFLEGLVSTTDNQPNVVDAVKTRLGNVYGADFNKAVWLQCYRDAKASITASGPSKLLMDASGTPKACLANAVIVLRQHCKIGMDEFANRMTFLNPAPWGSVGHWSDRDDLLGTDWLQHHGCNIKTNITNEAAQTLAMDFRFNPVADWLTSLKWDGEPRVDTWMTDFLGVDAGLPGTDRHAYTQMVGYRWLGQACARIMKPGCKAESVLVLEGPEGRFKSTALRALANGHLDSNAGVQWFSDSLPPIDHDEIATFLRGVWIFEIAELEAIRGKAWTHTRKFFSIQRDRYRAKYGRNIQDSNRMCVFAASTNEEKWGNDPAGLRRFWPLRPGKIRVDALLEARDQLWAEAMARYSEGEIFWFPEDQMHIARAEQLQRYEQDAWQVPVAAWLKREETKFDWEGTISIEEVLAGACAKSRAFIDKGDSFRVSNIMRRIGWEAVQGVDGEVWQRKAAAT